MQKYSPEEVLKAKEVIESIINSPLSDRSGWLIENMLQVYIELWEDEEE